MKKKTSYIKILFKEIFSNKVYLCQHDLHLCVHRPVCGGAGGQRLLLDLLDEGEAGAQQQEQDDSSSDPPHLR